MKKDTIVFVAITDYDNLGIGYMSAILSEAGFKTRTIDFRVRRSYLLKTIKQLDPFLIGFSVIFLNYIDRFAELILYLRKHGICCHFTAGGHYASLRYDELFNKIPELDSIVRFEGEYPVLELAKALSADKDWRTIRSLAFRENGVITANALWPPEKNLDKFPFPLRSAFKEYCFGKRFTVIIAGRGCVHNCSFCNTREFYRQASGQLKRVRKPEMVVAEMNYLFHNKKCSVFLFHDDDFPVKSKTDPHWLERFCSELERTGLNEKIIWKINCRPDEVDEESFVMMKKNGLFMVFLGLEDGTNTGLKKLNKQSDVKTNLHSARILRKLNIGLDFGFMLFQPYTTFSSLNENLGFLKQICGDGYTPATFLRLVPLYDTPIEKELKANGRLCCNEGLSDYVFGEDSLNLYYDFITECFSEWMRYPEGVENISRWARNYFLVYLHYYSHHTRAIHIHSEIKRLTAESNLFLIDTMLELSEIFESGKFNNNHLQETFKKRIKYKHDYYKKEIINDMAQLLSFVEENHIKPKLNRAEGELGEAKL